MKIKSLSIFAAVAFCLAGASNVFAYGEPIEGKCLTEQEAAKIQPMPKGGYPTAEMITGADSGGSSSIVSSPYNTSHRINCSKCKRGGLVLDPLANKVFRKP